MLDREAVVHAEGDSLRRKLRCESGRSRDDVVTQLVAIDVQLGEALSLAVSSLFDEP